MTTEGHPEAPSQAPFDTRQLSAWLSNHVGELPEPLSVEAFTSGQSNPTYLLRSGHQRWVLRSKPGPAARLLPSAHAIEREYRVMAAVGSQGVAVPDMVALCMDEGVIGRSFFVMSHVPGISHLDQSLPGLQAPERRQIYQAMAETLAKLHGVDVARAGLADFGKTQDYVSRQIARWCRQFQATVTEPIPEMDHLMAWLPANLPRSATQSHRPVVIHGDFRLDNLIFSPAHDAARALIDWELSTLGHPLADLSYHTMSWHIPPEVWRGLAGQDLDALGIPSEREQIQTYARLRPDMDIEAALDDWHFYLAFNLFRMAAILQGIGRRLADGLAASPQAQANAAAARPLAVLAWHTAQSGARIGRRI